MQQPCAIFVAALISSFATTSAVPGAELLLETFDTDTPEAVIAYASPHRPAFRAECRGAAGTIASLVVRDQQLHLSDVRIAMDMFYTLAPVSIFTHPFAIEGDVGGAESEAGSYNVGLRVGNLAFIFHPGYSGGAFRIISAADNTTIFNAERASFTPSAKLAHLKVIVDPVAKTVAFSFLQENRSFEYKVTSAQYGNESHLDLTNPAGIKIGFTRWSAPGYVGIYDNLRLTADDADARAVGAINK